METKGISRREDGYFTPIENDRQEISEIGEIPFDNELQGEWRNDLNSHDTLKNVGKEKVASLKKTISEINDMIEEREELSNEIIKEGEKVKADLDKFISDIKGDLSRESEVEKVKGDLRKKKVEISEMQINEKVSAWKDIALLRKELREKQRELDEREGRMKMLDKILREGD